MWVNMLTLHIPWVNELTRWFYTFHWCESSCWLPLTLHIPLIWVNTLTPTDADSHWLSTLHTRYVTLYFRDDVTHSIGDTWWPDTTPGNGRLAADGWNNFNMGRIRDINIHKYLHCSDQSEARFRGLATWWLTAEATLTWKGYEMGALKLTHILLLMLTSSKSLKEGNIYFSKNTYTRRNTVQYFQPWRPSLRPPCGRYRDGHHT